MAGTGNESDREVDRLHHDLYIAQALRRGAVWANPWQAVRWLQQLEEDWKRAQLAQRTQAAKDYSYRHDVWRAFWEPLVEQGVIDYLPTMPPDDKDPF